MAGENVGTYAGQAAIAYQDALNQARNAQNALFRQYGFVSNGANGYSVENAQSAFDPNTLFDKSTGSVDQARLDELVKGLRMGGTGVFADISRGGASAEADAIMEARSRGFGNGIGGGLMNQRRNLVESQTKKQTSMAKNDFITGLGQGYMGITSSWQQMQAANALDAADRLASEANKNSIVNNAVPEPGTAQSIPPANARNYQRWTDPVTGQKLQFIGGKWKPAKA